MAVAAHAELISAMTEFYILLRTAAVLPEDVHIYLPPHPPGAISTDAALAAGYSEEAVEVIAGLPYLGRNDLDLMPSTQFESYYGENEDVRFFEDKREMVSDGYELMPPTAVRLTINNIYGYELIYDVESKLLIPWEPIENPDDAHAYFHVPGVQPRGFLDPLIEKYRSLNYILGPLGIDYYDEELDRSGGVLKQEPHYTDRDRDNERQRYKILKAVQKMKELYLECGWDVNAREQTNFRRDELVQKRERYWQEVLEPMYDEIKGPGADL